MEQSNWSNKDEQKDILGKVPTTLIKWSSFIFIFFTITLFIGAWLFHLPTTRFGKVELFSEETTVLIRSTKKIRLTEVLVKDSSLVKFDEIIAIKNGGLNYDNIKFLNEMISKIKVGTPISAANFSRMLNLDLVNHSEEYKEFLFFLKTHVVITNQGKIYLAPSKNISNNRLNLSSRKHYNTKIKKFYVNFKTWEEEMILRASKSGQILFNNFDMLNHEFKVGDPIFSIIPYSDKPIFGFMTFDNQKVSDIAKGQKVRILIKRFSKLDNVSVEGKVLKLIEMPDTKNKYRNFRVIILLPKKIQNELREGYVNLSSISGSGYIYTNNESVIYRILRSIKIN